MISYYGNAPHNCEPNVEEEFNTLYKQRAAMEKAIQGLNGMIETFGEHVIMEMRASHTYVDLLLSLKTNMRHEKDLIKRHGQPKAEHKEPEAKVEVEKLTDFLRPSIKAFARTMENRLREEKISKYPDGSWKQLNKGDNEVKPFDKLESCVEDLRDKVHYSKNAIELKTQLTTDIGNYAMMLYGGIMEEDSK